MIETVAIVVLSIYAVVTTALLLGALDGYLLLAKEKKQEALDFARFIIPAIGRWPYLLCVITPKMYLANRRNK